MEDQTPQTNTLSWEAEEFIHHTKTGFWYIAYAIVAAGLIVYAIFTGSIIVMLALGLTVVLAFIYSHRKPRMMNHELTASGIAINGNLYPYKNIRKFWIIYEPPQIKTLNIETTAYLNSHTAIQLGDQDPVMVKLFLQNYAEEDLHREESFIDVITPQL